MTEGAKDAQQDWANRRAVHYLDGWFSSTQPIMGSFSLPCSCTSKGKGYIDSYNATIRDLVVANGGAPDWAPGLRLPSTSDLAQLYERACKLDDVTTLTGSEHAFVEDFAVRHFSPEERSRLRVSHESEKKTFVLFLEHGGVLDVDVLDLIYRARMMVTSL